MSSAIAPRRPTTRASSAGTSILLGLLLALGGCARFGFQSSRSGSTSSDGAIADAPAPPDADGALGDGGQGGEGDLVAADGVGPVDASVDGDGVSPPDDTLQQDIGALDGTSDQSDSAPSPDTTPAPVNATCLSSGWCWQLPSPQGYSLVDAWIVSSDSMVAVGEVGTVLSFQSGTWTLAPNATSENLNGVWASSAGHIFAVGNNGTILRYDGAQWHHQVYSTTMHLMDVWGTSETDVYAVGATIIHYDGTSWTEEPSVPAGSYAGVGGVADHVFAVGGSGHVARKVGSGPWTPMASNLTRPLSGVWGADPSNVWVVGTVGNIAHFDGVAWTPESINGGWLGTVWGRSATEVYFSGAGSMVYDGASYELWGAPVWMMAMGDDNGALIGVSSPGRIVRLEGSNWVVPPLPSSSFSALWGSSDSDIYAFGTTTYHFDGARWSEQSIAGGEAISSAWGVSASEIYAVGGGGFLARYDGTSWQPIATNTTNAIKGVWADGPDNIVIVTEGTSSETIGRYDGTSWQNLMDNNPRTHHPTSVWGQGSTFFVGFTSNRIIQYQGSSPREFLTTAGVNALWGSSTTNVVAVGASGTALHYDGTDWQPRPTGAASHLHGLHGSGPTEVYAVGEAGVVRRFNGTFWQALADGPNRALSGVWVGGATLWVGGARTTVLSRPR